MLKKNNGIEDHEGIDKLIDNTFEKIKNILDANTTVGSVIKLSDKIFVLPISKISVGLISGGNNNVIKKGAGLMAGSSTGFNITPVGFVVINESIVDYISASQIESSTNKMFDVLLNLSEKLLNNKGDKNENEEKIYIDFMFNVSCNFYSWYRWLLFC